MSFPILDGPKHGLGPEQKLKKEEPEEPRKKREEQPKQSKTESSFPTGPELQAVFDEIRVGKLAVPKPSFINLGNLFSSLKAWWNGRGVYKESCPLCSKEELYKKRFFSFDAKKLDPEHLLERPVVNYAGERYNFAHQGYHKIEGVKVLDGVADVLAWPRSEDRAELGYFNPGTKHAYNHAETGRKTVFGNYLITTKNPLVVCAARKLAGACPPDSCEQAF